MGNDVWRVRRGLPLHFEEPLAHQRALRLAYPGPKGARRAMSTLKNDLETPNIT